MSSGTPAAAKAATQSIHNDVYSPPARGLPIHCECLSADAGAGGRMWLEARRLARGDCAEFKKSLPSPAPGANFLQYQHKRFRSIPRTILSKPGKPRIHTCLGAGAGATVLAITYTHTTHSSTPEPHNLKNIHSIGLRPLPPTPKRESQLFFFNLGC